MLNLCSFSKWLGTTLLVAALAACVKPAVPLPKEAESIKVTDVAPPKSCKFLGQVSVRNENGRAESYSSREELQISDTNRLRTQALNMGANVIVLTQQKAIYREKSIQPERFKGESKLDVLSWHIMKGDAYACPMNAWRQMPYILNKPAK